MDLQYIYNEDRGTLHIEGFCCQAKDSLAHCRVYPTEKEAYDYAGQQIRPCKTCQKKKHLHIKQKCHIHPAYNFSRLATTLSADSRLINLYQIRLCRLLGLK